MTGLKTQRTKAGVKAFIDGVEDEQRRKDARVLQKIMGRVTGKRAATWGDALVGFDSHRLRYADGREGEWFLTGCSPRKQALSVHVTDGFKDYSRLLKKLGKVKHGKACLQVKKLDDIDLEVLEELIARSVEAEAKSSG